MFKDFIYRLPEGFVAVFEKQNLVWHFLAAAATFALVQSGFDWWYFESTRGDLLQAVALSPAIAGFFVPIILPVGIYIVGELKKDLKIMKVGSAVAQAEILALVVSSIYKVLTGRIQPEFLTHTSLVDISRNFNFGFLRHGIFWGWPSSHTAVAFAGMAVLTALVPKNKLVRYLAIVYALYIGLGVSVSIHWFSDALAGAILGTIIGWVISQIYF